MKILTNDFEPERFGVNSGRSNKLNSSKPLLPVLEPAAKNGFQSSNFKKTSHVDTPTIQSPYGTLKKPFSSNLLAELFGPKQTLPPATLPGSSYGNESRENTIPIAPSLLLRMPRKPSRYKLGTLRGCGPPASSSSRSSGSVHSGALSTIHEAPHDSEHISSMEVSSSEIAYIHPAQIASPQNSLSVSFDGTALQNFRPMEQVNPTVNVFTTPLQQNGPVPPSPWLDMQHRGHYLKKSHSLPLPQSDSFINNKEGIGAYYLDNSPVTPVYPQNMPIHSASASPTRLTTAWQNLVGPVPMTASYLKAPSSLKELVGQSEPEGPKEMHGGTIGSARITSSQLKTRSAVSSASSSSFGNFRQYGMKDWKLMKQKDQNLSLPASLPTLSPQELEDKRNKIKRMQEFSRKVKEQRESQQYSISRTGSVKSSIQSLQNVHQRSQSSFN